MNHAVMIGAGPLAPKQVIAVARSDATVAFAPGCLPGPLAESRGWIDALVASEEPHAVLIGTTAAVKLVGKVDLASRNPLLLLGGFLRQTGRPAVGTLAGRQARRAQASPGHRHRTRRG